jgi:hypothetical protein
VNPNKGARVEAHELLHGLGMQYHNTAWECSMASRVDNAGSKGYDYKLGCDEGMYGNPFSTMGKGSASVAIPAMDMYRLHWMHADAFEVITASGTYELNPLLSGNGNKRGAILFNSKAGGEIMFTEWRTATGLDSSLADPAYVSNTKGLLLYSDRGALIDCRTWEPLEPSSVEQDMTQASINNEWYDLYGKFSIKINTVDEVKGVINFTVNFD